MVNYNSHGDDDHQHYCKWFYNDDTINEVLANNYVGRSDEDTNPNLITFDEEVVYANEYERAVLERDEDALYKIIEFEVNGCDAYLAVIYDPSKISVGISKYLGSGGQYIYDMAREQDAVLAINGGVFTIQIIIVMVLIHLGVTIADGKIITDNAYSSMNGGIIGFDLENRLVLLRDANATDALDYGIRDAVTMGPFLIVNGNMLKFVVMVVGVMLLGLR